MKKEIIGLILYCLSIIYFPACSNSKVPAGKTLITNPIPGQYVSHSVKITGFAYKIDSVKVLRTITVPETSSRYHPQTGILKVSSNFEFKGQTYVGDANKDANTDERFRILLVECTDNANNYIENYLENAQNDGWPGLDKLPNGCSISAEVEVVRNDLATTNYVRFIWPDKVNIKWLFCNIPIYLFVLLGIFILTSYCFGAILGIPEWLENLLKFYGKLITKKKTKKKKC